MHLRERISRKLDRMAKNVRFLQGYSRIQIETLEADWILEESP